MLSYLKIFLPISGFSLAIILFFIIQIIWKTKNFFSKKELLISCSLVLLNSLLLFYYNLGFTDYEINNYSGNVLIIFALCLQSLVLLCFGCVYIFSAGFLLSLLAYNLGFYNSQILSLYLTDGFTIILSIICLIYEFTRKKSP